jgi:nucleolar protein 14
MGKSKGGNASALHRLKKSLVDAGVVGQKATKKVQKSKNKAETKAKMQQKLQTIHDKFNPFDLKYTNQKQQILGRKVKGVKGKPSATKLRSEETVRHV